MLLGAITYKGHSILDFSPTWVIGTPNKYISFDGLDYAKQWLDEFIATQKVLAVKGYFCKMGIFPPIEDLIKAVDFVGAHKSPKTIVNKYFYE